MIFRSPVMKPLHELGWTPPAGNRDFRVTQRFGCTGLAAEPALGDCKHFHRAIDLSDRGSGAKVVAVAAGRVRLAGMLTKGGLAVLIAHGDGWWSEYAHLQDLLVKRGDPVAKGALIGHVGSTGANAAHLHFGVKKGVKIDPSLGAAKVEARYYLDDNDVQHWQDPWPLLEQNVRVHPRVDKENIRIRTQPTLEAATIFATVSAGRIRRAADGADLGAAGDWRRWGGQVKGARYQTPDGQQSEAWERIELDGALRFIASAFAVRSAS